MSLVEPKIIQSGNNYHVQHGDDRGLFVEFSIEAVLNQQKTEEEGRPIYEDKEYVTILIAGDTKTKRVRPVRHTWDGNNQPDPERWPRQWAAFKNQQTQIGEGTPITEFSLITKGEAMSLKAANIHTVEQLAELQENHLTWFGARKQRDLAIAYLEKAKGNSGISKMQAENEQLRADLEALKNQMAALLEAKPELTKKVKKKND